MNGVRPKNITLLVDFPPAVCQVCNLTCIYKFEIVQYTSVDNFDLWVFEAAYFLERKFYLGFFHLRMPVEVSER